ncbi:MAG TPA: helix-turn-helix transcriptional regulator, partial [Candidatus Elarobacter sp.]|nr:helix-turn-helix transcriptional regulator [Candidatus Elarobacter sp.]
ARAPAHGAAAIGMAIVRAGWADAVAGRFAQALARLDALAGEDAAVFADVAPLEAYAHVALGDFEAGERAANALIEAWASSDDLVRYSGALVWAARFALLRGDTTAAYELAREGERIARPFALRAQAAALHATLAEAALHAGDTALARREARAALRSADAAWYARDAQRTRALATRILARADALDGDLVAALAASDGDDPIALADAAAFAALAGAADAAERRARARDALMRATPVDGADAVALWAAAEMLDAFDAAGDGGVRTELRASAFDGLIARRAATPGGPRFETRIAGRLGLPHGRTVAHAQPHEPLVEQLTPREHEILELLAVGLTNREIAQRLILSARTVETHVARITGKLGVASRARAVARAVALGIVAPPAEAV